MVLFFHPAVHWLSRSLRRERELCTDALAVRMTHDPLALAEALQSVARLRLHFRSPREMTIAGTSLGGQTVSLLPRIQELIGMTPTRPQRRIWPFAALPAAGIIALIATAAGLARDNPPSSSATTKARPPVSATRADSGKTAETERSIQYEVRSVFAPRRRPGASSCSTGSNRSNSRPTSPPGSWMTRRCSTSSHSPRTIRGPRF